MNETIKRSISGVVYVALLLICISYSTESFFLLFGIFMVIAVYEFCNLNQIQKAIPVLLAITIFSFFYLIKFSKNNDILLLITTLLISLKSIFFLFNHKIKKIDVFSKYTYLVGYVILPFVFITKIPFGNQGYNPKIIISIFIIIWTNDTFAYLVGKSIGKHKLLEKISPKKTIEGFIGGVLFAILAGYLISKFYIIPNKNYQPKSIFIWTITALIIGVFGTIGDLIESKFKRIANVKDSGNIMPGHGGVLDRLDSVIFVTPFLYLFYYILNYVTFS